MQKHLINNLLDTIKYANGKKFYVVEDTVEI